MKKRVLGYFVLFMLLFLCIRISGCSIVEINNTTDKSTHIHVYKEAQENVTSSPDEEETMPSSNEQERTETPSDKDNTNLVIDIRHIIAFVGILVLVSGIIYWTDGSFQLGDVLISDIIVLIVFLVWIIFRGGKL